MKIDRAIGAVGAATVSGVLVALSLSGAAKAITDTVFRYSAPKTGYLMLRPAAFTPENLNNVYFNLGGYLSPATANTTCWTAPVNLPQGAKMTALAMWYQLMNTNTAVIDLVRVYVPTFNTTGGLSINAPVTGGVIKGVNSNITDPSWVADNRQYGYHVRVCLQGDASAYFYGARLTYTYSNAGD